MIAHSLFWHLLGPIRHLWWPQNSQGYALGSSWMGDTAILAVFGIYWRRHNCHVQRCWRLQWHGHPVHGHPVCRKHHPRSAPCS